MSLHFFRQPFARLIMPLFLMFSSHFAAGQTGVLICSDQLPPSSATQYLVLDSNYFLNFHGQLSENNASEDSASENNEQGEVFHLDADSPLGKHFLSSFLKAPTLCKKIDLESLVMDYPSLRMEMSKFQSKAEYTLPDGYYIFPLPKTAHNNGFQARMQPALIAAGVAWALSTWATPGWATIIAPIVGLTCFTKPSFCHYLYAAGTNAVADLLSSFSQARDTTYKGHGATPGTRDNHDQGSYTQVIDGGASGSTTTKPVVPDLFPGKGHKLNN